MTSSPASQRLRAFLYDRHASPTEGVLLLRLEYCKLRAAEAGWQVAGEFVDRGDDALGDDHRPEFDRMIGSMCEQVASGRQVVFLVSDWYRLSRDAENEAAFRARITTVGGYTTTAVEEDNRPGNGRDRVRMLGRTS